MGGGGGRKKVIDEKGGREGEETYRNLVTRVFPSS